MRKTCKSRKSRTLRKKTYKSGRKQRGGSPFGGGPIHIAIMSGDIQKALDLINQGANLNEKDNEGRTPLMLAAILGFNTVVNLLISKGANMHEKDKYGADVVFTTTDTADYNGGDLMSYGDKKPIILSSPGEYEIQNIFINLITQLF